MVEVSANASDVAAGCSSCSRSAAVAVSAGSMELSSPSLLSPPCLLLLQFLSAPICTLPPFQICLSCHYHQLIWAYVGCKLSNTFNISIARLVALEKQPQLIDVHNASRISIGNCQPVTLRLKDLFLEPFFQRGEEPR